jgi:hypothetical protein
LLDTDKRFRKYQTIEAQLTKSSSDARLESYKVNLDSIMVVSEAIGTERNWEERKAKVLKLASPSLCWLKNQRDKCGTPTLGIFKPKSISALRIEETSPEWSEAELARLRQYPLFTKAPANELEKIPFTFSYEFTCDTPGCPSHKLSCTDWEIGAAFRGWKKKYGKDWRERFIKRFETEMILKNDTRFFVGTIHGHPDTWIIIGLFYPKK